MRGPELARGNEGIDGNPIEEAAHEYARPGQQHEGQRELEDNKDGGEPTTTALAEAARTLIQDVVQIGPGRAQCGQGSEEHRTQDAESGEISKHGVVGSELNPV